MGTTKKTMPVAVRAAVPVAIVAIVWYVTLPILRYTLLMQEQKGLFLMTPDYFREVLSGSWPITTLISDFLVQFYSKPSLGALLTGLIVAKVYLMVCTIFRFTSFRQVIGGLGAALTWLAIAHANTPHTGVVILMFTFLAALLSTFLPYRKNSITWKSGIFQATTVMALFLGSAAILVSDRELNQKEKWYAVEYTARVHDWDLVLAIATPELCRKDQSFVPYALLALNAKGMLAEKMFDYPITGPESLGDIGEMNWSGYSLRSQIHEVIGCPNEAIHLTCQMGMALPHGTGLGLLRQLIRLEIESGQYSLARKHAAILSRNPMNRKYSESALKMVEKAEKTVDSSHTDSYTPSYSDLMISNNAIYNLGGIISYSPYATDAARERLLCHLLLSGDMTSFNALLKEYSGNIPVNRLPKAFRAAASGQL